METKDCIIRRGEKRDIPAIQRLLLQVNDVHAAARPDLFVPGHRKYNVKELEEILKDEKTPVFVYVGEDGEAIGYCFCLMESHLEGGHLRPHKSLYIDDLCVDAAARGRGIGRSLYEYVRKFARNAGCSYVTLNVWEGNESAMRFYRGLGMEVRKTTMEMPIPNPPQNGEGEE